MPANEPILEECVHCSMAVTSLRSKGLCYRCYECPEIRGRYPTVALKTLDLSKFLGRADTTGGPTNARPGSPEKIRVLAARAANGVPLWHPGDEVGNDKL